MFIEQPLVRGLPAREVCDQSVWGAVVVCGADEMIGIPLVCVDCPWLDAHVLVVGKKSAVLADLLGGVPDHAHDTHAGMC